VSEVLLKGATARLGERPVLDSVNLSLQLGELVALCGPNGAGKTSVLRAALGLMRLDAGAAPLGDLPDRERARRAAYLPQDRRIAWNLPAVEVAALGAPFLEGEAALERARTTLEAVGVGDLADRGVAEMSGGERARVLLARALVSSAPMLLADEPAAGLDPDARLLVMERLRERADGGHAVLVSLHDLGLAARFADRVVVMRRGGVMADGPPLEALRSETLMHAFGLTGRWIEGPDGPLLSARRA